MFKKWKVVFAVFSAALITIAVAIVVNGSPATAATGTVQFSSYLGAVGSGGTLVNSTVLTNPTAGACYPITQTASAVSWVGQNQVDRGITVWSGAGCTGSTRTFVWPNVPVVVNFTPKSVLIGV